MSTTSPKEMVICLTSGYMPRFLKCECVISVDVDVAIRNKHIYILKEILYNEL